MILSPHLTVAEWVHTSHREFVEEQEALWYGSPAIRDASLRFAIEVFEPVRRLVGPLHVSSGLRCRGLNAAVGGQPASRHLYGLAADVIPLEMDVAGALFAVAHALRRGELPGLDRAIDEFGGRWLHLQSAMADEVPARLVLSTVDGREYARVA